MLVAVNESERVELAKAYVALSNSHRLELIFAMFGAQASYHSANVGVFTGKAAIASMMTEFFARFPDVHWQADNYRCTQNGDVQFDFEMNATDVASGENIQRAGVEEIRFAADGLILRLEVRKQ